MQKFSASDSAFAGFRLVREHFKTVAIWAVLMTISALAVTVLSIQLAGEQLAAIVDLGAQTDPDPAETFKVLGSIAPLMLWTTLYSLVVYSVLLTGLNRMILRPGDNRSAYLRLGAEELRQAGVLILVNLILTATYIVVLLVGAVIVGVLGGLLGAGVTVALSALLFLVVGAAVVFVSVRLSFAGALTFAAGKITIRESWALTKGRFWPLFGAYAVAVVLAIIVYLLLMVIIAVVGAAFGGGIAAIGEAFNPDMSSLAAFFTPAGTIRSLFSGTISILTLLIIFAPAPSIYQELGGRTPDAAV